MDGIEAYIPIGRVDNDREQTDPKFFGWSRGLVPGRCMPVTMGFSFMGYFEKMDSPPG